MSPNRIIILIRGPKWLEELKMTNNELFGRITVNPEVMVGKPTVRGFRITVEQILKALAANISINELLEDYPELELEDIRAVLLYAAFLKKVEKGERIAITSRGHQVTFLVPVETKLERAGKTLEDLRKTAFVGDVISPVSDEWELRR